MKPYLPLIAFVAALSGLCACNSETPLDHDTPLYQDYVVECTDGTITAFASFYKYNKNGEQVKLNNGASITVNGQKMTYYDTGGLPGSYNYVLQLPSSTTIVTYDFQRNQDTHLISETDLGLIPEFTVEEGVKNLKPSKDYGITISDGQMYPLIRLQAVLASYDGVTGYNAITDDGTKTFRFVGVRAGTYTLYTTLYTLNNVTATDGAAKGTIKAARVVTTPGVTVE